MRADGRRGAMILAHVSTVVAMSGVIAALRIL
jgi:hypothetical protein